MTIGTKSVLFGAHCFPIHGWFVAWAWWLLFGFPWDPRLWVAFFVHDLGYVGKPNMDGPDGETHPLVGARIMSALFDYWRDDPANERVVIAKMPDGRNELLFVGYWGSFALLHSRYYARTLGMQPSRLCVADKLAIALVPWWLYLPMVRATGEIEEYMAHAPHRLVGNPHVTDEERRLLVASEREWYRGVQSYCRRWAHEHRDGRVDAWTADAKQRATFKDGVWR